MFILDSDLNAIFVAGAEEDQKENGVEETVPIVSFSDVESEKGDRVVVEDTVKNVRKTKLKKWTSNENTRLKVYFIQNSWFYV